VNFSHSENATASDPKCSPKPEVNVYFLIFLLGQTLHGIGATPLFSIGTSYLDENVSQKASPVYLGYRFLFKFIDFL
jgi:organic anion transporter 4A